MGSLVDIDTDGHVWQGKRLALFQLQYFGPRSTSRLELYFPVPFQVVPSNRRAPGTWQDPTEPLIMQDPRDGAVGTGEFNYSLASNSARYILLDVTGYVPSKGRTFDIENYNDGLLSTSSESSAYDGPGVILPWHMRATVDVEPAALAGGGVASSEASSTTGMATEVLETSGFIAFINSISGSPTSRFTPYLINDEFGVTKRQPAAGLIRLHGSPSSAGDFDILPLDDGLNVMPWGFHQWMGGSPPSNIAILSSDGSTTLATFPRVASTKYVGGVEFLTTARQPLWDYTQSHFVDAGAGEYRVPLQLEDPPQLEGRDFSTYSVLVSTKTNTRECVFGVAVEGGTAENELMATVKGTGASTFMRLRGITLPSHHFYASGVTLTQSGDTILDGSLPAYVIPAFFTDDVLYALDKTMWMLLVYAPTVGRWFLHANRGLDFGVTHYQSRLTLPGLEGTWVSELSYVNDDLPTGAGTAVLTYQDPANLFLAVPEVFVGASGDIALETLDTGGSSNPGSSSGSGGDSSSSENSSSGSGGDSSSSEDSSSSASSGSGSSGEGSSSEGSSSSGETPEAPPPKKKTSAFVTVTIIAAAIVATFAIVASALVFLGGVPFSSVITFGGLFAAA
jgi:hypothetical protein